MPCTPVGIFLYSSDVSAFQGLRLLAAELRSNRRRALEDGMFRHPLYLATVLRDMSTPRSFNLVQIAASDITESAVSSATICVIHT